MRMNLHAHRTDFLPALERDGGAMCEGETS